MVHTKALLGAVDQHLLIVKGPVVWPRDRVASHAHRAEQTFAPSKAGAAGLRPLPDRSHLIVASVVLEEIGCVVVFDENGHTIRSVHVVNRVDQRGRL